MLLVWKFVEQRESRRARVMEAGEFVANISDVSAYRFEAIDSKRFEAARERLDRTRLRAEKSK